MVRKTKGESEITTLLKEYERKIGVNKDASLVGSA
jgi:hypothetical protein